MILFDISTYSNASKFLSDFLDISENDIYNSIKELYKPEDGVTVLTKKFINHLDLNLDHLDINEISFIIYHVTSAKNHDSLEKSLKLEGLLNLQEVLIRDTELKRFLNKKEVYIDVDNKYIKAQGNKIKIKEFRKLYAKIYKDYQINGFFSMSNNTYIGNVHESPEFLPSLSNSLNKLGIALILRKEWSSSTRPFIVKYRASLEEIYWYKAYDYNYQYDQDVNKIKLKSELIRKALNIITKTKFERDGQPEEIAIMHKDVNVLYNDIIAILPYNSLIFNILQ